MIIFQFNYRLTKTNRLKIDFHKVKRPEALIKTSRLNHYYLTIYGRASFHSFLSDTEKTLIGGRVYLRVFWVNHAEVVTFGKPIIELGSGFVGNQISEALQEKKKADRLTDLRPR